MNAVSPPLGVARPTICPYLLVSGDFRLSGGMDRCNYELASYLANRGGEVHIVAHHVDAGLRGRSNVTVHHVPKPLGSYLLGEPLLDRVGRRWAFRIASRGGRVVVNGSNCRWDDVNWLHHIHAVDNPPLAGSILHRGKVWATQRLYRRQERSVVPLAQTVITTCQRTAADARRHLGVAEDRIHVVYLGTDPGVFHPRSADERRAVRQQFGLPLDKPLLAFVGALGDRRKGFDTLFKVWQMLCAQGDEAWGADLVVVGRGQEVPAWKRRAVDCGLASRVHFMGFVPELPKLLASCDAHVLPSRYEGYSLATQEALCCGLPAFITATAGIAERYPADLRDLLIEDPEDERDLARRLITWLARREHYRMAVERFGSELRAHTWQHMAERMHAIFEACGS